jgi:hypothetical protein
MAFTGTYTVGTANMLDKILAVDSVTGLTKNVTPEGIIAYTGASYFRALLNQASTAAPLATDADDNTITDIVWARSSTGIYTGTSASASFFGNAYLNLCTPTNVLHTFSIVKTSDSIITLKTYLSGTLSDDILINQGIEIIIR